MRLCSKVGNFNVCWSAEFYNGVLVFFVDNQNFIITFMIQTFVWSIICLFTLLVIRNIIPIPIVMETWKGKYIWKCFLSVPGIDDPSNLPRVSSSYPIHTSLLSADHPRILRPPNNRQAQGHYVTDEQCIHIPANMITHCLRNKFKLLIHYTLKTLLRRLQL